MMRQAFAWLRRRDRGVTTIELALLLPGVLLPLTFAILGAGSFLWTQGALQSVADMAARCGAISSPNCSGGDSGVQSYAVSTANAWLPAGTITTGDVLVNAAATDCTGITSHVEIVEIKASYIASAVMPPPFNGKAIQVCAYYPTS